MELECIYLLTHTTRVILKLSDHIFFFDWALDIMILFLYTIFRELPTSSTIQCVHINNKKTFINVSEKKHTLTRDLQNNIIHKFLNRKSKSNFKHKLHLP